MKRYIVIGAGIIGSTIARELARRKSGAVTVLEKEPEPGRHASGRNSGVIHSGINQKPGGLKAKMCLEGSRRLREYCRARKVPMNECGTLVIARNEAEEKVLERLLQMGRECSVEGLKIIDREELAAREPSAAAGCALLSPSGATVDSLKLLQTVVAEAKELGVQFQFGERVLGIDGKNGAAGTTVSTSAGKHEADYLINCAGLYADEVAHMMGVGLEYRVIPFRGEYMEVDGVDVRSMIYQPPDLRFPFLSIHLTRETDGRVLAGPSAVLALGREAYDKQITWPEALGMAASLQFWRMVFNRAFMQIAIENAKTSLSRDAFFRQIQGIAPGVRPDQIKPARAGIRAQMVDRQGRMLDDLLVQRTERSTHVLNAVSPGMTCSFAFAEHIVGEMEE